MAECIDLGSLTFAECSNFEFEKPVGAKPTLTEQSKSADTVISWLCADAAKNWLQHARFEGQKEAERKKKERVVSQRVVSLGVILYVVAAFKLFFIWICEKASSPSPRRRSGSDSKSETEQVKCHFCSKSVPVGNGIKVSLGNHKVGWFSQSWTVVRVKIPCCSACADLVRKESRRTIIWRLAITMAVYILCVVFIKIRAETPGLAIFARCMISILPSFIVFAILVRLRPMPFTPSWYGKVAEIPQIEMLIDNGFEFKVGVQYEKSIPET